MQLIFDNFKEITNNSFYINGILNKNEILIKDVSEFGKCEVIDRKIPYDLEIEKINSKQKLIKIIKQCI